MAKLIMKRLLLFIPALWILITISFFIMRMAPGGPFTAEQSLPPAVIKNLEARYQLDKPLYIQYANYIGRLLQGDLGPSFSYRDYTVNELIQMSFPVSFRIGLIAFILAVVLGYSGGIIAAIFEGRWPDRIVMMLSTIFLAMPSFVVAPFMILLFAVYLDWLPAGGWFGGKAVYLVLPVASVAAVHAAGIVRIVRNSLLDVLATPFITTLQAYGLPQWQIVVKNALRPAFLPLLSYLGPVFVSIITGSVVIESIFSLPGVGQYLVNGALTRDYFLVLGMTVVVGSITLLFNLLVDLLYVFVDPAIRKV